ncbi:MAG: AEC family transporter [Eubacteriales bacterium]|nr:AEC family transporter [Eubacteriales bacterium]
MAAALNQVLILILIIVVGFVAARVKIIDAATRARLSELLLLVCTPMQVLLAFQMDYSQQLAVQMAQLAVIGVAGFGASAVIGYFLWRKKPEARRKVLWLSAMLSNCGFMGIPVFKGVFGDVGVVYASIFVLVFTVYTWTLGVAIMGVKGATWKNIVLQPALIACVAGVVLFLTQWRLPGQINAVLQSVGDMTTPLAMIIIGSLIAEIELKGILSDKDIPLSIGLRLLVLPALMWAALSFFDLPRDVVKASVLIMGMPIATNTVLFATRYDCEPHFAGTLVVGSTLFSMLTLAFWMIVV